MDSWDHGANLKLVSNEVSLENEFTNSAIYWLLVIVRENHSLI